MARDGPYEVYKGNNNHCWADSNHENEGRVVGCMYKCVYLGEDSAAQPCEALEDSYYGASASGEVLDTRDESGRVVVGLAVVSDEY